MDKSSREASGSADRGAEEIVPLDLSNGSNKDESGSEASREEDPSGKNLRGEPEALRERVGGGARTGDNGRLGRQPGHQQRRRGDRRNCPIEPQPRRQRRRAH